MNDGVLPNDVYALKNWMTASDRLAPNALVRRDLDNCK